MKISASIYSDQETNIDSTITKLIESNVDMIHVDCNDDLNVFVDIEKIHQRSGIPVDLHIITDSAERFYPALESFDIEYVCFQYENLTDKNINVPDTFSGQLGLAITSNTDITVFEQYKDNFDFILFMATIPGKSGGEFDKRNFRRIRQFQSLFPDKKIHVDGGVNAEVSFILRNMGVYASVSGSYLFNSTNISTALLNLKLNETESHFLVRDFMRDLTESPVIEEVNLDTERLINVLNYGKLGFCLVLGPDGELSGIIGNADLRKGILDHLDDLNAIDVKEIINRNPITIQDDYTVHQMLRFIKNQKIPLLYLPVVDSNNKAMGTVNFINLIKGEL